MAGILQLPATIMPNVGFRLAYLNVTSAYALVNLAVGTVCRKIFDLLVL